MTQSSVLVIDTREGKVLSHTNELNQIKWEKKQLTTGDYALYNGDALLAVFERKTLEDYGASIKDGRANNKDKMLALRAKTGCRVFYIIEGPKSPSRDAKFARIPYGCIQSSIDHLMMRDGILVINTLNTVDTAKRLVEFVKNTDTLMAKIGDNTFLQQQVPDARIDNDDSPDTQFSPSDLTAPIRKSDHDIVREMWACFKGITVETADSYASKWTIAEIVQKKIPRADIESHKLPNRRAISKNVVNALLTSGPVIESKLLSKIPQVSARTANDLLRGRPLSMIIAAPEEIIAIYTFGKLNTKIGKVRAANIVRLFHYRTCDTDNDITLSCAASQDRGNVLGTADAAMDEPADPAEYEDVNIAADNDSNGTAIVIVPAVVPTVVPAVVPPVVPAVVPTVAPPRVAQAKTTKRPAVVRNVRACRPAPK